MHRSKSANRLLSLLLVVLLLPPWLGITRQASAAPANAICCFETTVFQRLKAISSAPASVVAPGSGPVPSSIASGCAGVGIGSTLDSGTNNFGQSQLLNPELQFSGTNEVATVKLDNPHDHFFAVFRLLQRKHTNTTTVCSHDRKRPAQRPGML